MKIEKLYHVSPTKFDEDFLNLNAPVREGSHANSALGIWCFTDLQLARDYGAGFGDRVNEVLELTVRKSAAWCLNPISDWRKYCSDNANPQTYVQMRRLLTNKKQLIFGVMEMDLEVDTCCVLDLRAISKRVWL